MIYLLQLSLHTGEYRAGSAISHLVLQIGQHSIKEMEKILPDMMFNFMCLYYN